MSLSILARPTTRLSRQALALPAVAAARAYSVSGSGPNIPQPAAPLADENPRSDKTPVPANEDLHQAPNWPAPWSTSQTPRQAAYHNARFEQTAMQYQPQGLAAIGMSEKDPIRLVNARKATCDGGGGPLGHPKIFINLDKPGPKACGYCGIRFEQAHHAH